MDRRVKITILAVPIVVLTVFGVLSAYLWLKIVDLETKMRDLGNNYVQLRESLESLLSEISNL